MRFPASNAPAIAALWTKFVEGALNGLLRRVDSLRSDTDTSKARFANVISNTSNAAASLNASVGKQLSQGFATQAAVFTVTSTYTPYISMTFQPPDWCNKVLFRYTLYSKFVSTGGDLYRGTINVRRSVDGVTGPVWRQHDTINYAQVVNVTRTSDRINPIEVNFQAASTEPSAYTASAQRLQAYVTALYST